MTSHEWQEHAAAYALGALAAEERRAFEAHLAGCAECRAEVKAFAEVAGALAHAAPAAEPPAGLRDRVLAEARRVRPIGASPRRPWALWLAAAAALLAVAGGVESWRLTNRVHELGRRLASADSARAVQDSVIALLTGPGVDVVSLAGTGERQPSARILWNHARNRFVIFAFDLPAAPPGRTYQLWAIAKGHAPISMGTFNTDAAGRATVQLAVDQQITALGFVDNCGLTEEPSGGSPQPTETPRLLGAWRHTD